MRRRRRLGDRQLGCNGSLALQLGFVPVKGLLPAILEVVAVVVFWQTMLRHRSADEGRHRDLDTHRSAELCPTMWTLTDDAEHGRVAGDIALELTTFLGGHGRLSGCAR
jgi:hypothetical protein